MVRKNVTMNEERLATAANQDGGDGGEVLELGPDVEVSHLDVNRLDSLIIGSQRWAAVLLLPWTWPCAIGRCTPSPCILPKLRTHSP